MFYLCTVDSKFLRTVFGSFGPMPDERIEPKYKDLNVIMIGQKQDASGYLLLTDRVVPEFVQQRYIPGGFDFIWRQEWGLAITEEIIHRVISTLRAESYPPMADYLDAKVKGDVEMEQKYLDACLAVKEKYPKFSW